MPALTASHLQRKHFPVAHTKLRTNVCCLFSSRRRRNVHRNRLLPFLLTSLTGFLAEQPFSVLSGSAFCHGENLFITSAHGTCAEPPQFGVFPKGKHSRVGLPGPRVCIKRTHLCKLLVGEKSTLQNGIHNLNEPMIF